MLYVYHCTKAQMLLLPKAKTVEKLLTAKPATIFLPIFTPNPQRYTCYTSFLYYNLSIIRKVDERNFQKLKRKKPFISQHP
jgi:ABC-type sugar transport system permease subunit